MWEHETSSGHRCLSVCLCWQPHRQVSHEKFAVRNDIARGCAAQLKATFQMRLAAAANQEDVHARIAA